LAQAGFTGVSVAFTHRVGDGLHSAIIKASKPAAAVPAGHELPVVQQSGC
jgi:arsenite methyltransferase